MSSDAVYAIRAVPDARAHARSRDTHDRPVLAHDDGRAMARRPLQLLLTLLRPLK